MQKTTHTTGTWAQVRNLATKKDVEMLHENTQIHTRGKLIAVVFGNEESEANAKLIAAAPELLKALILANEVIDRLSDDYAAIANRHANHTRGEANIIRDAINKAKGND